MNEKTTFERLMKHTMDDLADAAVRIGIEPTDENMRKADLAALLADAVPERKRDILLRMRECEYMALSRRIQAEQPITIAQSKLDDPLENALQILEQYALAWRTTSHWQLSPEAREMMLPDEELKEDLVFHDLISDMMEGWLLHVGMMPVDTLLQKVAHMPGGDVDYIEFLKDLAFALLVGRNGLDVIYAAPGSNELWAVCADLEDPDKLHARVTSLAVASLPYPALTGEELIDCVRGRCLPGDKEAYQPLTEWIIACRPWIDGQECQDILDTAVYMLQNDDFDEMVYFLMDTVEPRGEKYRIQGEKAITHFVNHVPLWQNKGYNASEMARQMIALTRKRMPGRNDPCPCGSGKKYKQCCGRLVN